MSIVSNRNQVPFEQQDIETSDQLHLTLFYREVPLVGPPSLGRDFSDLGLAEEMGLAYNVYLNAERIFGCKNCKTHLATHDSIISRVSTPYAAGRWCLHLLYLEWEEGRESVDSVLRHIDAASTSISILPPTPSI